MHISRSVDIFLRLGVSFAFLFPAINAVFDPYSWIGYFPVFLRGIVPDAALLHIFGVVEVILAIWILSGRRVFYPSLVCAGMLFLIVVLNLGDFQVLFRDIPIMFMALALAVMHRPSRTPPVV